MSKKEQRKGTRGENELLDILLPYCEEAKRNDQRYVGGAGRPDVGVTINGVRYHIEAKRRERLNLPAAIRQAEEDAAEGQIPVVCHRKNRAPWYINLRLNDFLRITAGASAGGSFLRKISEAGGGLEGAKYFDSHAVSRSELWELRRSPMHYRYLIEHPREDTPALRFGRAVHCLALTPELFAEEFAVRPDVDGRTKAGKEELERWRLSRAEGQTELSAADAELAQHIADAIRAEAGELLAGCATEQPILWTDEETGNPCRAKPDAIREGVVIDLKTCEDAGTAAFQRDVYRYGYHVQAAHYLAGVEAVTGRRCKWYFVAAEKKPPFAVHILEADDELIERGEFERRELLARLKECRESGIWPGYEPGVLTGGSRYD